MKCDHWFYRTIVFPLCACAAPKNEDTDASTSGASDRNEEDEFEAMDDDESADDGEENTPHPMVRMRPPKTATIQQPRAKIPAALSIRGTSGTLAVLSEMTPAGIIEDVIFSISLEHTSTKDLSATLTSPTGVSAVVFDLTSRPICSSDMDAPSLSDEATTPISSGSNPFRGPHKPTELLSVFGGQNAAGQWTLTTVDDTVGDTSTLVH